MTQTAGEHREVRDLATRGTAIGERLQGLEKAVTAARGHLDAGLLDETEATVARATGRLRLSAHHTVVAIAGATGSGKSSTFNALTGLELSSTGVRRPTTSWATACVWGSEGAEEVLDWLGIPPRHQTMRDTVLDTRQDQALDGVVLMDLPDHDSTEVSHHLEVDRLVELADLLVWVVDPQKYADAALHDRYLAPYATHAGVMLVVLNHVDTIAPEKRQGMVDDVKRLLAADGLGSVKVIPISAREGIGVDELRQEIASRVEQKRSTTVRVEADIAAAAGRLDAAGGEAPGREITPQQAQALEDRVAEAAGIPTVASAVERVVRSRGARAVAWPPVSIIGSIGRRSESDELLSAFRAGSRPQAVAVQRAAVDNGVRALADETAHGLATPWADAVRTAATARLEETDDALDQGLQAVDLRADRLPGWLGAVRVLQWLLLLVAIGGGAWWATLAFQGSLGDAPEVGGMPLPPMVLAAGLAVGLLLWLVFRPVVGGTARRRGDDADAALREVVSRVLGQHVVAPSNAVLASYADFRAGLAQAKR